MTEVPPLPIWAQWLNAASTAAVAVFAFVELTKAWLDSSRRRRIADTFIIGAATRLREAIRTRIIPALELYEHAKELGPGYRDTLRGFQGDVDELLEKSAESSRRVRKRIRLAHSGFSKAVAYATFIGDIADDPEGGGADPAYSNYTYHHLREVVRLLFDTSHPPEWDLPDPEPGRLRLILRRIWHRLPARW